MIDNQQIANIIEGDTYIYLNKLAVSVNTRYRHYSFSEIKNGNTLKESLEKIYYKNSYKLSDEVIISEAIYIDNKLNKDGQFKNLDYIKNLKKYNPFINENVFIDLYYVDVNNKQSILNFINKYGLLGSDYKFKSDYYIKNFANPKTLFSGNYMIKPIIEDYSVIKENIKIFKATVNLWHGLKVDNINEKHLNGLLDYLTRDIEENFNYFEEVPANKNVIAKTMIQSVYDEALKPISPILRPSEDGYKAGYTSSTLLGVIYFQLYKIILNQKQLYKCKYCGKLNSPNTKNRSDEYCKPQEGIEGHSKCNNDYNNMIKKYRPIILNNKLDSDSIKELSKNIEWTDYEGNTRRGRPFKEVLQWLKNYTARSEKNKKMLEEYKDDHPNIFK